jgi:hypothetical protein
MNCINEKIGGKLFLYIERIILAYVGSMEVKERKEQ